MERGVGVMTDSPACVTTDSLSNWQVGTRHASANRARHALRRWRVLGERIAARRIKLVHLPGATTPADFLTKKTDLKKVNASVYYITNESNVVAAHYKSGAAHKAAGKPTPTITKGSKP